MNLVLDASLALAWLFERQKKEEAECAQKVLLGLANDKVVVPALWHTEISNVLLVGERRKVISEAQSIDYLNRLSKLPILTDDVSPFNRRELVMGLAREHNLTAYDAVYLDLALRTHSTLATFDNKLAAAMQNAGGSIYC